jgi:hypothetical protein
VDFAIGLVSENVGRLRAMLGPPGGGG